MIWVTRKQPHIDRIACAWTIKRFIDFEAEFQFIERNNPIPELAIPYDLPDVEIGHKDNSCSHETLLKLYKINDEAVIEISRIVHDIDLGKFDNEYSAGIELILKGLIFSSKEDRKIYEKGFEFFDYLYKAFREAI